MKIIAYIFSLYLVALSLIPCGDSEVFMDDVLPNLHQDFKLLEDHQHSTADLCTPFCQCHCCHVHVAEFNMTSFQAITPEIYSHQFIFFNHFGKEIINTPLQPPRV